ncbi:MAG: penicillin-binding transpeptidase domain-containing protein, partial [Candidatus Nanopelagicales bacterium]|nr:penicillin-binding transpeptidase domain-containing protein [Candidatus Nanopelagicales bacterium]
NGCAESMYPFYCEYVVHQIENDRRYGPTPEARVALLQRGGMVIKTALDPALQDYATSVANRYIPKDDPSRKATAIAMVDPVNGEVRTLAQNRDWGLKGRGKTTYNYAVDAQDGGTIGMQAGSTFKLFTLLAAMEDNQDPTEYISSPASKLFAAGDWGCKGGRFGQFSVSNSTSSGTMNMFKGTAYSVNTYFVELQRRVGLCDTVAVADRMGIKMANGKPLPRYPSFTLGSLEISPLSLASAYATTANHGVYCRPHSVRTVTDLAGRRLFSDSGDCKRVVSRESADAVTAILTSVIDGNISGRTGQKMSLGRDAAGKTGTTDSNAAVWFAGFTPELATAVWVGDPRGGFKYPMKDITINGRYYSKVYGSYLPGPIWREVMSYALQDIPPASFDLDPKFDLRTARNGGGVAPKPYSYNYDSDNYNFLRPTPTPTPSRQRGLGEIPAPGDRDQPSQP